MLKQLKNHFPSSGKKWKNYIKVMFPIILGSLLFAMNSFIDNFMVGGINQGTASLSAASSWTSIFAGFLFGSAASGSVIFSQYYFAKDYEKANMVSRLRFLIGIILATGFGIAALIFPEQLISVFLHKPQEASKIAVWQKAIDGGVEYLRIISISWFLMSLTFNYGNQFREIGYGMVTMYWGLGTLLANATLNSILIFGFDMGVAGAAWASVAARMIALIIGITFTWKKDLPTKFLPWKIVIIDRKIWAVYFKRWFQFFSVATVLFFITFRNHFYDQGYPTGSLGSGVGGMLVIGVTGAIMNVFITTFNSLSAMSANFVASELGKKNFKQAKKNADELKVFNTSVALFFSILMLIFASLVPFMSFLSHAPNVDNQVHLTQIRNSLYVVCFFYPIWIWFSTSLRNGLSGGKGWLFTFMDWFISGPIQLSWAAIVMLLIVPTSSYLEVNFWAGYAIFFTTDLIKLVLFEIYYYRYTWLDSITEEKAKIAKSVARDHIARVHEGSK